MSTYKVNVNGVSELDFNSDANINPTIANGVTSLDFTGYATKSGIQSESYTYATDTGAVNAYVVTLTPVPTLTAGLVVIFKAANTNTGASTLNVNSLGVKNITKTGTTALAGGEIAAGQVVQCVYDGTEFQLIGSSTGGGGGVTNVTATAPITSSGGATPNISAVYHGNSPHIQLSDNTGTTGHVATFDANGNLTDGGAPATGSVTSVAVTVPAEFSVSGSPITSSGTIAISKANETANTVWAGPTSGGAAAPAFRALVTADLPANTVTKSIGITIDGGAASPSTGSKGFVQVNFNGTIAGWTLVADQSGSAQITVKKATYAAFPTTTSIVAAAPPSLSSVQKNTSTTLTGWTTAVSSGDIFEFNLDSVTTCRRLTLILSITLS